MSAIAPDVKIRVEDTHAAGIPTKIPIPAMPVMAFASVQKMEDASG